MSVRLITYTLVMMSVLWGGAYADETVRYQFWEMRACSNLMLMGYDECRRWNAAQPQQFASLTELVDYLNGPQAVGGVFREKPLEAETVQYWRCEQHTLKAEIAETEVVVPAQTTVERSYRWVVPSSASGEAAD